MENWIVRLGLSYSKKLSTSCSDTEGISMGMFTYIWHSV